MFHPWQIVVLTAILCGMAALAGCGSSVTGFRSLDPLPQFDAVTVESTCSLNENAGALVVLATGQHTALDADFDLFVAMLVPDVVAGVGRALRPDEGIQMIVVRSSSEIQAFMVQYFDVTGGELRWEGGRPVLHLRAESESKLPSSLPQVPAWQRVEATLRADSRPAAFKAMSERFCATCFFGPQPRGPLEQMVRLLRALDQAAGEVESALDPFAPRR